MEKDKDFAKAMNEASDELKKAALVRRETRRWEGGGWDKSHQEHPVGFAPCSPLLQTVPAAH
jgi:hypothetical protein